MSAVDQWHADDRLLAGYVTGVLALPAAMSLEQHVMRCLHCREALAGQLDPRPLERVWRGVESRVEGSLRQRWRRLLFRIRTGASSAGDRSGLRAPSWRPGSAPVWFGGMAVTGAAVLSAGYLVVGAISLGAVRDAEPVPHSPFGVRQGDARQLDLGPLPGATTPRGPVRRDGSDQPAVRGPSPRLAI